jgi:O-antigen/teichoic acid export membrane protein
MINLIKSIFIGDSIKAKAFRGSTWLAIGNIIEKLLAFISKIIFAKLLIPGELGLIVLIISLTALFECITEVGVKQCVIQEPNGEYLNF